MFAPCAGDREHLLHVAGHQGPQVARHGVEDVERDRKVLQVGGRVQRGPRRKPGAGRRGWGLVACVHGRGLSQSGAATLAGAHYLKATFQPWPTCPGLAKLQPGLSCHQSTLHVACRPPPLPVPFHLSTHCCYVPLLPCPVLGPCRCHRHLTTSLRAGSLRRPSNTFTCCSHRTARCRYLTGC